MKGKWPKVSAVIATYNRPGMLHRALESVLGQTFKDFDVWVVDDGSKTAKSVCEEMDEKFAERGVALNCLSLEENSGYYAVPRNQAIVLCKASYIAYLDDDNEWDPDHLEALMEEMERGGTDLVYSRWRYRGEGPGEGQDSLFVQATPPAVAGLLQSPQLNFVDSSSILHSKAAAQAKFGGTPWNDALQRFGDWEFVGRWVTAGLRLRGLDKVTFTYHWHGANLQLTRAARRLTAAVMPGRPPGLKWKGKESVTV